MLCTYHVRVQVVHRAGGRHRTLFRNKNIQAANIMYSCFACRVITLDAVFYFFIFLFFITYYDDKYIYTHLMYSCSVVPAICTGVVRVFNYLVVGGGCFFPHIFGLGGEGKKTSYFST